nr:alkane 1-monooxygenase [Burkholderiaceae bacterium]
GQMSPPIDDIEQYRTPAEKHQVMQMLTCSFAGSRDTVKRALDAFIEKTGADELMVSGAIFDHAARLRSYELLGEIGRM